MKEQFEEKFDSIFRENLSNYEQAAPENVLNKIKSTYSGQPKPKTKFTFGKVATIIVAAGIITAGIFLILDGQLSDKKTLAGVDQKVVDEIINDSQTPEEFFKREFSDIAKKTEATDIQSVSQAEAANETTVNTEQTEEIEIKEPEPVVKQNVEPTLTRDYDAFAGNDDHTYDMSYKLSAVLNAENSVGIWNSGSDNIIFSSETYANSKNDPNATITVSEHGTYELTWTESAGEISKTDDVTIHFNKSSDIEVNASVRAATCHEPTGFIRILTSGGIGKLSFEWITGNFEQDRTFIENLYSGIYQVKVTDEGNSEVVFTVEVPDSGIVDANFTYDREKISVDIPIYFTNLTYLDNNPADDSDNIRYQWVFSDGNLSSVNEPMHIFNSSGSYFVRLTAISEAGCSDIHEEQIVLSRVLCTLPNVFSPNGDGINDIYKISCHNVRSFKAIIFNREGEMIYTWDDIDGGWNGKINGNDKASSNVYFVYIKCEGTDGESYTEKSFFHLYR